MAEKEPKLLRTSELARRFNVDRTTVTRWITTGQLPAIRVGGVWRVSEKDLKAFIKPSEPDGAALNAEFLRDANENFKGRPRDEQIALLLPLRDATAQLLAALPDDAPPDIREATANLLATATEYIDWLKAKEDEPKRGGAS